MKTSSRFRPQQVNKLSIIRDRRLTGRVENYSWQTRSIWVPAGMPVNRVSIMRRWQQIHHYSRHTAWALPNWRGANAEFNRKFLGSTGRASDRYLNTYSAHSWL